MTEAHTTRALAEFITAPHEVLETAVRGGAAAAVMLVSDEAYHIHGQMLFVDGGITAWQQPGPPEATFEQRPSAQPGG